MELTPPEQALLTKFSRTIERAGIPCPKCGARGMVKVIDSRANHQMGSIRRRRRCMDCAARWTTYEISEERFTQLVKQTAAYQHQNAVKDLIAKFAEFTEFTEYQHLVEQPRLK